MDEKFISRQNLNFLLYEVLGTDRLSQHEYFGEFNKETLDMILRTAYVMSERMMRPYLREMDKNPPEYKDGEVYVNPAVKEFILKCGEIGFIAAPFPFEAGGQQLPRTAVAACNYMFSAANYSLSVYPGLTSGAANLILNFGSDEMKGYYLPKMFSGEWQGTMALTEPEAGSSLSDVKTRAARTDEGYFKIKGQKIFISAGTHNAVDNVVHLMLAKIEGAPAGVKGISLFVVPKLRGDGKGGLEPNDLFCGGIEHKLGYRGSPITQLHIGENGDCRGWLVGEENQGLAYMFRMMNEERINVGIGATGIASAAYYDSLKYADERKQGRPLSSKDPESPQCELINHPDIKRMLLYQKAVSEGSLSLALQASYYLDMLNICDPEEREKYDLLTEFLTPIVKSYPSEKGILSTSAGIQILGGYGYCEDFNLELYYRDMRIHPIHEGTTGIQGQDILGRKALMKKGKALQLFMTEIKTTIKEAGQYSELSTYADKLSSAIETYIKTSGQLFAIASQGKTEEFLSDATLYLEMTGTIAIAWQWLLQGVTAVRGLKSTEEPFFENFYSSKIHTMKYFFRYELPAVEMLSVILADEERLTTGVSTDIFID
ncbi:MAG TPA: acyl-CoA dehydrogenase [Spirochaetota bacterium]|nr:acyl-CoA dehydrogenase [Spirochaetota bacterium]HPJ36339.1 acyl-CoA dehydrogenase [Spirochaetota bacterium]